MAQLFSNNATATLATSVTNVATTITLTTGHGARFNAPTGGNYELLTFTDGVNIEIVKVTARSSDVLTVTRAQEGTTGRAWASSNTTVYAGITKGTLMLYRQFDETGNERGSNALDVQTSRAATDQVASGEYAVAVGAWNKASGSRAIAIGAAVVATGAEAIAVGSWSATASGGSSIAIGNGATAAGLYGTGAGLLASASGQSSVALGHSAIASQSNAVAIGSATISATEAVGVGLNANSDSSYSVAVGSGAKTLLPASVATWQGTHAYATTDVIQAGSPNHIYLCVDSGTSGSSTPTWGTEFVVDGGVIWRDLGQAETAGGSLGSVAIGQSAQSFASNGAIAMGRYTVAAGYAPVAIGNNARAARFSVALGFAANARHDMSFSLGAGGAAYTRHTNASVVSGVLPSLSHLPDWNFGSEYAIYTGSEGVLMSEPFDLCGGSTWAATTAYAHGRVVKPTTPNGKQYIRYCDSYPSAIGPDAGSYTAGSSGGSEPSWPTTALSSVADGGGSWICLDNSEIKIGTLPANFVVTRVGIVVYEYSSVSVQPTVSFGKATSHTLFVNNQTTTNLTAANKCQFWDITASEAVDNLTLTIDTLATGTKLLCRAVWHGYYAKHWL